MSLFPNNVTSQNGIEKKQLIAHLCYILIGSGCDHTNIEHHTYVV